MRKMSLNLRNWRNIPPKNKTILAFGMLLMAVPMFAGGAALSDAATTVREYLPGIKNLIKAIAVVVAIVGGIRIFNKWQNGDQDVTKEMIGWVGAIIFILLVPTFVEAVFPAS